MNKKIKSIKVKIIMFLVPMLLIAFTALAVLGYKFASNSLKESNLNVMSEMTKIAASRADDQIQSEIKNLEVLASNPIIINENIQLEEKVKVLQASLKAVNQLDMSISNQNGEAIDISGNKKNVKTTQSFIKSIKGEAAITNPFVDPNTKKKVISYSVPIKNSAGNIIGIITSMKDCMDFSKINSEISFLKTGSSIIVDNNGNYIVAADESLVSENKNITNITSDKASLDDLNNIGKSMTIGDQSGIGKYMYDGKAMYMTYSPIGKTGLSIGITVEEKDLLSALNSLAFIDAIVTVVMILLIAILIIVFTIKVINRLNGAKTYVDSIANGDFYSQIDKKYISVNDEISSICISVGQAKESVGNMIKSVKENASVVRTGSLSLNEISEQLAVLTEEISASIGEVAISTNKESCDFKEISNKLSIFGDEINLVKDNVNLISEDVFIINNKSLEGSRDIEQLNDGIVSVNDSFGRFSTSIEYIQGDMKNVHEITNIINGISEQINLLSFNAAIEAASAGEAGRGFNVVALEVKKLSDKSKESAQNISKIINRLMKIIQKLVEESNNMDGELQKQKDAVYNASSSFAEIAVLVSEIAPKVTNINDLFNDISNNKDLIVDTVSELSEEIINTSNSLVQVTDSSVELAIFAEKVSNSSNLLLNKADDLIEKVKLFKIEKNEVNAEITVDKKDEKIGIESISSLEKVNNDEVNKEDSASILDNKLKKEEVINNTLSYYENLDLPLIENLEDLDIYQLEQFEEDLQLKDFGWGGTKVTEIKDYIKQKESVGFDDDDDEFNIS
ncbi:methyl-accepting chemotaxis protein [Clostridium saccharoperbutylacetonicum]|uniref:Methyl-accepting chemotaxis protein n=1 Tax=Clostridium saccharoperbutylacetonicum N1-4(HMT) TaxID=931276 RepID=M1LMX1_9CLOT|nr:methyl-accepting chemotaxis protein [Clostridium saccharoperbutylacetonicum]AGF54150.1 methyl-accepting chemotaxis protein [Clostridium saccharoperbutylacetonicum N1-4(HMT)]NRT59336.1 methyl-accepting chemotaxis protein [Clostridium saccharoperbutylacetonicum]NSB28527.1 methyl-accepting chemotaxis protein [Clostridium saccharoperbutylacetonicum]NSB42018.1 methyl-accepting chemotaxis protein [Clostridium saccharoperbutylacetonicum]